MSTLYERIMELCKEKGVSGSKMCLDLGMSKSTMSELKAGRTKSISTSTAQKIAEYFGVSIYNVLGIPIKTIAHPNGINNLEVAPDDVEVMYTDLSKAERLLNSQSKKTPAAVSDEDIKVALFGGDTEVTDEMWHEVMNYAEFLKQKYGKS